MQLDTLCSNVRSFAHKAGKEIIRIWNDANLQVTTKADQSPLTAADLAANTIICDSLKRLTPHIPILSEENIAADYQDRKKWTRLWLVDPLDGTKEFINRNGDFTVNIALIEHGCPILGVVYVPVTDEMFWAYRGGGAWRNGDIIRVSSFSPTQEGVRIVASRSHSNRETIEYTSTFKKPVITSRGSSLKLLLVASGQADVYPRLGPTMEWDTAAADAIVREAGGKVYQYNTTEPLIYNKEKLLNPHFIVQGTLSGSLRKN